MNHPSLVGTWKLNIARSQAGIPPFLALHTYFADGTMLETTSMFGKSTVGPGHGVWQTSENAFVSTFEVFTFDECGEYAGTVRVRAAIQLAGPDQIQGKVAIDVHPPNGMPQVHVDNATFEGVRIKVGG